ncbi:MAG: NADH-quinone oxidoreductase subunit J [Phycisphaerae bacterium]
MSASTGYLLYCAVALGGAGVYLLLPKSGRSTKTAGGLVAASALVLLLTLFATRLATPGGTTVWFYVFSAVAAVAGARVITHPRPVFSALYFILVVLAVAALLVLLQAEFVAVALVIIYAGAIIVTYLFVIMLAQQSGSPIYDRRAREPFLAVLCGFILMAAIVGQSGHLPEASAQAGAPVAAAELTAPAGSMPSGNTARIGAAVMTRYVIATELAGVLLLVSMIGAIAMSKKKVTVSAVRTTPRPLGQAGREVAPF